jgi:hypothetical protein
VEQSFECGVLLHFGSEDNVLNHARIIVEFLWGGFTMWSEPVSADMGQGFRERNTYDEVCQGSNTGKAFPCLPKGRFLPGLAAPCQLYQRLSIFIV